LMKRRAARAMCATSNSLVIVDLVMLHNPYDGFVRGDERNGDYATSIIPVPAE
jgi:hypothetical protein